MPNALLEEIWKTRDQMGTECGYDFETARHARAPGRNQIRQTPCPLWSGAEGCEGGWEIISSNGSRNCKIELEKDQALILFEWLTKQCDADSPIGIELIELFAMDCLQAKLYAELEEPLKPDYQKKFNGCA